MEFTPQLRQSGSITRLDIPGGPITSAAQVVFNHPAFEKVTMIVICVNALWIGFEIDWNDGEASPVPPMIFDIGENVFCGLFTVELLTRFLSYNSKMSFFTHGRARMGNLFDLFLVTLMILEVWILRALASTTNLNNLSVLRILRLLRLLRISRVFRMVPELAIMVKNMAHALRTVSSTLLLEISLMYVFAIVFTYWAKNHSDPCSLDFGGQNCLLNELFGSILKSFVTLMQILVVDNTFIIIRPVLNDTWYMGGLLILFLVLATWTVLNMLIGIICELAHTGTQEEKMRMLEQRVREVFASMDEDGSGSVTRDEFNGAALKQLEKLGISKDVMKNAFSIIDEDGSGAFEVDEFLFMIFKLLNPPKSQDIQVLDQKLNQIQSHLSLPKARRSFSNLGPQFGKKGSMGSMDSERAGSPRQDSNESRRRAGSPRQDPGSQRQDSSESFSRKGSKESLPRTDVAIVPETLNAKRFDDSPAALHKLHAAHKSAIPEQESYQGLRKAELEKARCASLDQSPETAPEILSRQLQPLPEVSELAMAQEIFEKLQQIAQNAEKVEHALQLVHGWKARETTAMCESGKAKL